jgi:hypothetical protein
MKGYKRSSKVKEKMNDFRPERIFIYEKIKDSEMTRKIITQFPSAKMSLSPTVYILWHMSSTKDE